MNVPLKIFHPQINKKTLVSDLASSVDIFNIVKILNKKSNIDKIFEKIFLKMKLLDLYLEMNIKFLLGQKNNI